MSNGKVIIILFIVGLRKNNTFLSQIKVLKEILVDLSNYATKANIKNISHVDTSSFALK